jgi:tRNA 5-methylaminomethyl-2-thiouridine biosynthesis bifunctional protein
MPSTLVHPDRLRAQYAAGSGLCVLDSDFGDAQTFLAVWSALADTLRSTAPLHYVAFCPQSTLAAVTHTAHQAPLATLHAQLLAALPPAVAGYQRLLLQGGRVMLTLIVQDDVSAVHQFLGSIDTIYLKSGIDRFLNKYTIKRFAQLATHNAQLYAQDCTSQTQAALLQAGFLADQTPAQPGQFIARYAPPWQRAPVFTKTGGTQSALVIGAGLAGAAIAERLTHRGWDVTVLEASTAPAQQASGNLAGIYMPMVSQDDNPASRFIRAGFHFAQQVWAQIGGVGEGIIGQACGVLQVARDETQASAFQQAAAHWHYPETFAQYWNAAQASRHLGMTSRGGWWFPQAGWLRPSSVCAAMLNACQQHPGAFRLQCEVTVSTLVQEGRQWIAKNAQGEIVAQADNVILANGMGAQPLNPGAELPLSAIRGQVSHVKATQLSKVPCVLCGDGYVTPAYEGIVSVGATYGPDTGQGVCLADHQENIHKLRHLLVACIAPDVQTVEGRIGLRCVTPDRMPIIGALPINISDIPENIADKRLTDVPRVSGLYGLLGYASRGLITAPLAAEILACQLNGEPLPIDASLHEAIDPARFVQRDLRKKKRPH